MATKKTATKKSAAPKSMPANGRNPEGGLTARGRAFFAKKDGSNLKAGVTGAADTPEKMKRKGSFLVRTFSHPRGPMLDDKGKPTRLALSAHAWGEPVPKTEAAAKKLAARGEKLLEKYHATSARTGKKAGKKSAVKKAASSTKNSSTKKPTVTAKKSVTSAPIKSGPRARKSAAKKTSRTRQQAAIAIAGRS